MIIDIKIKYKCLNLYEMKLHGSIQIYCKVVELILINAMSFIRVTFKSPDTKFCYFQYGNRSSIPFTRAIFNIHHHDT